MALKVVGAGLGRTGTLSLKLALEQLGFGPCYHMMEVLKKPEERVEAWRRAGAGEATDWDAMFDGYQAAVDWPAARFYAELAAHYPDAKVILSRRAADSWFRSTQTTIFSDPSFSFAPPPFRAMVHAVITDSMGGRLDDRDTLIAKYEAHNAGVLRTIAPERLLVYEAGQGWAPLCAFLGVPAPDAPYPKTNTSEEWAARREAGQNPAPPLP